MPNRLGTATLYGSARLGAQQPEALVYPRLPNQGPADLPAGSKRYELTNHLGNVLSTVSDLLTPVDTDNNNTTDHFTAIVHNQQAYYPFGMLMPGLQYTPPGAGNTRYGFNGKENDDEVKGRGIQQDYGMRYYDSRLGKFLSVDPLAQRFPYYSPYQFAGLKPIVAIDIDGLEDIWVHQYLFADGSSTVITLLTDEEGTTKPMESLANAFNIDLSSIPKDKGLLTVSDHTGKIIRKEYTPTAVIVEDSRSPLENFGMFMSSIMPESSEVGTENWGGGIQSGREGGPFKSVELGVKFSLNVGPVKGEYSLYFNDYGGEKLEFKAKSKAYGFTNKDGIPSSINIKGAVFSKFNLQTPDNSKFKMVGSTPLRGPFYLKGAVNGEGLESFEIGASFFGNKPSLEGQTPSVEP